MSKPKMPIDANNNPMPVLGLKSGGAHIVAVTAGSIRNTTTFNAKTKVISVCSTVDAFVELGNSSVSASGTSHYIPAGLYYDLAINQDEESTITNIAVIRVGLYDGTLYISEKE